MTNRGAGCMGNPLVRFYEGQEFNHGMGAILWHRRESRRKQRRQTSPCSHGRLLPTRREVYAAQDTKLEREVAIKVLPEALSQDRERLARFEREAKLLAAVNHPGIATLYGLESSSWISGWPRPLTPRRGPRRLLRSRLR